MFRRFEGREGNPFLLEKKGRKTERGKNLKKGGSLREVEKEVFKKKGRTRGKKKRDGSSQKTIPWGGHPSLLN